MWWADEDADYIRTRSTRYPHAVDMEPECVLHDINAWPASGRDLATCNEAVNYGEEA